MNPYFFLIIYFIFNSAFASQEADVLSGSDLKTTSTEFPIKLCVGELVQKNAHGTVLEKKSKGYNYLKINGYNARSGEIVRLKKTKYSFVNAAGSFSYDFKTTSGAAFAVRAAMYGGLSIEPSKTCSARASKVQ